ncbi:autotransporter domain-containing protein [Devosia sp. LjRoot16]|uniref:autotransporter family protein n=1 Tax=Devosia sp. LjRoot16 TaxID=3342271 RepID=UPI003ECD1AA9
MGLWTRTTDDSAAARAALLVLFGTIASLCSASPVLAQYVVDPGAYPTLTVTSGDQSVTQSGAVSVIGQTTIVAGTGTINLTQSGNDFGGQVVAAGSGIALTDANALLVGVLNADSGVVSLSAGGMISQIGLIEAGTLNLNGTGNVILNSASNAIQLLDNATIIGDFSLTNSLALTINSLTADDVSLTVANGVTVGATGVITADQVHVNGNLKFTAGSTFNVVVDPLSSANSLIAVTGNVDINGGTVAHIAGAGDFLRTTRIILTTEGTLTGAFADATSTYAFLTPRLIYDYDLGVVALELARNDIDFVSSAATRNQTATAQAIDSIGIFAANPLYDAIALLPDDDALIQASFDALSGEIAASAKGALIEDSRFIRDAMGQRLRTSPTGPSDDYVPLMGYAPSTEPMLPSPEPAGPTVWAYGFSSSGTAGGDGNAAALDHDIGGLLVGTDGLLGDWRVGLLAGYSRSGFEADDRSSSGSSDSYHLGLYGGTAWGALSLRTGLAYTLADLSTQRLVAIPWLDDSLSAAYGAQTLQAFGELAYAIETDGARLEPFVNLAHVNLTTDGYTEEGGPAALTVASSSTGITFATLGARAELDIQLGSIDATLLGMLGWRHAFGDLTPTVTQAFAAGDAFTIAGAPIASDSVVIEAGLDLALNDTAAVALSYLGQISSETENHGAKATLAVSF